MRIQHLKEDLDFFFAEENIMLDELCTKTGENKQNKKVQIRKQVASLKGRQLNAKPGEVKQ